MKKLIFVFAFISLNTFAQGKYLTKAGRVTFEASVPSFEEVKASNNSVTAILNTDNGEFATLVLVKGFRFKNALMEEHFNENYAESDKFPKATFKGKLIDFSNDSLDSTTKTLEIIGILTFHGVSQNISTVTSITKSENSIKLSANFSVKPSEFDIKIPSVVRKKVAEKINISFEFELNPK